MMMVIGSKKYSKRFLSTTLAPMMMEKMMKMMSMIHDDPISDQRRSDASILNI